MGFPCAENRYPAFPGVAEADRVIVKHLLGATGADALHDMRVVHGWVKGEPNPALPKRPTKTLPSKKAHVWAFVEHGRWLVSCPWCPNAQFAPLNDPRFYCVECRNAQAGGEYITVLVPTPAEVAQIEKLLERVWHVGYRNWYANETVDVLRNQVESYEAHMAAEAA